MPEPARRELVVAVDGPSGSGKSSVSRGVAARLGYRYLDTGAMYRAVTWWMLTHGVDVNDPRAVSTRAGEPTVEPGLDPAAPAIRLDGHDVSTAIREPEVTKAVSAVAAVPEVRARLVILQREAIRSGGIVIEGRDIGTVVCPEAGLKVFLTASPEARAQRRSIELTGAGTAGADESATLADLERRDQVDSSRAVAPLAQAADAVLVDATDLNLEQTIEAVVALAKTRLGEEVR